MPCVLCKNAETKSRYVGGKNRTICPICGEILEAPNDAYLCYGDKKSKGMDVLFTVSDRYIFFHKLKGFERIIYGLGIIFGIILAMIVRSVKEKRMPYSFVDINDVDYVIAPYKNRKFKKEDAIKFVMKNGTDFIVKTTAVTIYPVARFLDEHGVKVVDGKNKNYGLTFCEKPFFKPNEIGRSVAPSAANKIKMFKKNFVASPVVPTNATGNTTKTATASSQTPIQKAVVQKKTPEQTTNPVIPTTIAELGILVGAYNTLTQFGISYVSQLVELSKLDLEKMGMKAAQIEEVERALVNFKFSLKANPIVEEKAAPSPKTVEEPVAKREEAVTENTEQVAQEQPSPKKDPNVKFCRKCGEKLRRDDVFCMECGADQR